MDGSHEIIAGVLAVAVVLFGFWGGPYVLRPMDLAAKAKTAPVQFTILDFFSLTAYFAVPLAVVGNISRTGPGGQAAVNILLIGGTVIAVLIWWGSVRTAAKAGIHHTAKRFLMVGIIVPITYPMSLMGGFAIAAILMENFRHGKAVPQWLYLVSMVWLLYFVIARRIVVWILSADVPKEVEGNPWSNSEGIAS